MRSGLIFTLGFPPVNWFRYENKRTRFVLLFTIGIPSRELVSQGRQKNAVFPIVCDGISFACTSFATNT